MIKSFLNSFKYAFCGIISTITNERNMRVHIVAAVYVLWLSGFYHFSKIEYAVLFIVIAMVIVSELFNTAIENAVDLVSTSYNKIAKKSKDAAAGAVLFSAFCAIAVGVLFFADTDVLYDIFDYFRQGFIRFIILLLSLVISMLFIFKPKNNNHKSYNKEKH